MGGTTVVGGRIGSPGNTEAKTINTGALLADTPKAVTHNLGLSNYQLEIHDTDNNVEVSTLKKDPGDPTNKIIIEVAVALPGGLDVSIIGYN